MFKKIIADDLIVLKLVKSVKKWPFKPIEYHYEIRRLSDNQKVGYCDFRLLMNDENYYGGNIGYMIFRKFRGNNYAYHASKLLCSMAAELYDYIIITCSPDNAASVRIIEKLSGVLQVVEDVPSDHYLYKQGEKVKNIYNIYFEK